MVLLAEVVATSAAVASTRSRTDKIAAIAALLRTVAGRGTADRHSTADNDTADAPAGPDADAIDLVVRYLSGELRQRRPGVGWATLRDLPPPAATPSLDVHDVDRTFAASEAASGSGSVARRKAAIESLFGRATADEQRFLVQLVGGELRQGAQAGIMTDAIAKAAGVPTAAVRRAAMLQGDLAVVAVHALLGGESALADIHLTVGRPVQPMLAQSAPDLDDALARIADPVLEWKIDGVRMQVHRDGSDVAVFTRTLDEVTARVPEVVDAVRGLPVRSIVLDGEAIALRPDGRPRPFQQTASRMATRADVDRLRVELPLTPWFFDVLHVDGDDLIDRPTRERYAAVTDLVPAALWVPRCETDDAEVAAAFRDRALAKGHEGVMVKSLSTPYEAGRRGAGWIKVKPRHTLDLVVLAAEWGHGRREGWLSNLHLGARDGQGGYVMLGKTFKGLTDELLTWQTEKLLALETHREGHVVHVRPELVVEIAFDGIQTSPRYAGGMALRFARVLRYRDDKSVADADTIDTVRALHVHAHD